MQMRFLSRLVFKFTLTFKRLRINFFIIGIGLPVRGVWKQAIIQVVLTHLNSSNTAQIEPSEL